jgi:teichuronic acid exporter
VEKSLKTRAIKALSWSLVQEAGLRALQLGSSIFLARILAPKEFGLVAMLSVFLGFAQALADGGFASALVQAKQPTEAHKCSIFYFNIFGSILLGGILWLAAPPIAAFYHQPLLTPMLRVLVLLPVINGFGLVQNALLVRNLQVKKQTIILAASTGVSGIVAVMMAWRGFGVWSLVFQQVTQSVARAALLWLLNAWRPRRLFSFHALGEMFRFGWGMLCSSIVGSIYDNLYPLLIGKFFSATSVGFFNRAQSLQLIASQSLAAVANRVTFPVFSALQDDAARLRTGLRKAMTTITLFHFPMMVGLAIVARPLILLLFTDKWAPSIPYLQLLALAGLLYPLHVLNLSVLMAVGRSDLFFRLEVFKAVTFLGTGLLTFRWGVMAMIWGQLVCSIVAYFLNSYFTKRLIGYSVWDQIRDLYPCLLASALMGLLASLAGSFLPLGNILQLSFKIVVGAFVYFIICLSMGSPALNELARIVFPKRAPVTAAQ